MRIFFQRLSTSDETKMISFPDTDNFPDLNFDEVMTNAAKLAPLTDQHWTYIVCLLENSHTFATDILEDDASVYFHIMSLLLCHANIGKVIHVVPTGAAALVKERLMNSIGFKTAIAVLKDMTYDEAIDSLHQLKTNSKLASIIMTAEDLTDSKIGEAVMETLMATNNLSRFVIYQAEDIINGQLEQELLCEHLQDYASVPVIGWARNIDHSRLYKVLRAEGMLFNTSLSSAACTQPISYINFGDDKELLQQNRYHECEKYQREEFSGESRVMSNWAIKMIEMLASGKPYPMTLVHMAKSMLGHEKERKDYGKRAHFGSSAGFEPSTLIKLGKELEWLGAFRDKGYGKLLDIMSDADSVALLKSGQLKLLLPIKQIFIYVYTDRVKGDLIDDLEVPDHDRVNCSCNPSRTVANTV